MKEIFERYGFTLDREFQYWYNRDLLPFELYVKREDQLEVGIKVVYGLEYTLSNDNIAATEENLIRLIQAFNPGWLPNGTTVGMTDDNPALTPTPALLTKLALMFVHIEEYMSSGSPEFDKIVVKGIVEESEVREWLSNMRKLGLVPEKRIEP